MAPVRECRATPPGRGNGKGVPAALTFGLMRSVQSDDVPSGSLGLPLSWL